MFVLPDLPYDAAALEPHIDRTTMEIHHGKHHAAYIKNLNDALAAVPQLADKSVEELISNLDAVPEEVRTKVRNNGGGHFNHSLFWQMMAPGGSQPEGKLLEAITTAFTSFDNFKSQFKENALGRFGSGWTWLIVENGNLKLHGTPNQDSPIMDGTKQVLLGLDVWEHAYYLKYQNRRADYVDAWWNVVNWKFVEESFTKLTV
jgi:superoxide dismutase, Fe-Mn family